MLQASTAGPDGPVLTMTRVFKAPRRRVFDAFADADSLEQWLSPAGYTCTAVADFRVGGAFAVTMRSPDNVLSTVRGTYRAIDPPERLVFSWRWDPGRGFPDIESEVEIMLTARGGDTQLTMTHRGLGSDEASTRHSRGWSMSYDKLAAYVEAAAPSGR